MKWYVSPACGCGHQITMSSEIHPIATNKHMHIERQTCILRQRATNFSSLLVLRVGTE